LGIEIENYLMAERLNCRWKEEMGKEILIMHVRSSAWISLFGTPLPSTPTAAHRISAVRKASLYSTGD
jgi:hypothetical protein